MAMALGTEAVLSPGMTGQLVRELQERLAGAGFSPGAIDGIFGPQTRDALIRFQNAKGLTPDGLAGPATWQALKGSITPAPAPPPPPPAPVPSVWPTGGMLALYAVGAAIIIGLMTRTRT